ncbi:5367_t:CDS:2 [Funneliformis caledonium]|uniref:5367_t:CDS:1 n=1 Tax=Funneliformis caledonium TaxID=1117310 RepID=A0A9N9IFW9_9GLOM|nr:5367_t:CDS:2 [Funneliformis caledonium]
MSLLVEGLYKHDASNWKKILTNPKYPFPRDQTAVDLKDRIASEQQLNLMHQTGQDRYRVAFSETYARSHFIKSRKLNYIEQLDSQIPKKFYALPFQTLQRSETPDV